VAFASSPRCDRFTSPEARLVWPAAKP
jgi:hypothetical protein